MNQSAFFAVVFVLVAGCADKKEDGEDASGYFPVVSYLQSQVRHVDTSLYAIVKIEKNGDKTDTTYLRREEFRTAAQDFLSLPNLAAPGLKKKYAETKLYDEDLKKVILTYLPKDKTDFSEITRQDVVIEPDAGGSSQVQSIYVESQVNRGDSTVQKKMTWNVNRNFRVLRLVNKQGQPEAVQTTDVSWSNSR